MKRFLSTDWRPIQLSEHFTLGECVVSKQFPELAAAITPTWEQANNLYILAQMALEPIRYEYSRPVLITSGLADEALNKARGGTSNSQHLTGEAVDIICPGISMVDVFIFCQHNLRWAGELILYKKRGHLHLALPNLFVKPDHITKED